MTLNLVAPSHVKVVAVDLDEAKLAGLGEGRVGVGAVVRGPAHATEVVRGYLGPGEVEAGAGAGAIDRWWATWRRPLDRRRWHGWRWRRRRRRAAPHEVLANREDG